MAGQVARLQLGWRVYGLAVMAMAAVCLAWGAFDQGQPVPKALPDRTTLAYVAYGFIFLCGLAVEWRRTAAWAAAALTAYYTLIVAVLLNGRVILLNPTEYVAYSGTAEQLAIAAGGLIVYAQNASIDALLAARITRVGQVVFGLCALIFGGAHFAYPGFTAPLVPKWLPPNQMFWAYATGVAHIAGGLAILTRLRARLGAILLTVMYASFTPLVHLPLLLAKPHDFTTWTENALNLALAAVAWVVADSLAPALRDSALRQQSGR